MREAAFAEIVLSLVMPRDRASATAGDLVESSRGKLAFISALFRTTAGAALRQMSLGTFAKAIVLTFVLNYALRALFFGMLALGRGTTAAWMGPIFGVLFLLLSPILIGRLVAGWMPGRELAVWISALGWVIPASIAF